MNSTNSTHRLAHALSFTRVDVALVVLAVATLLTACDARKPDAVTAAVAPATAISASAKKPPKYSEPAVTGIVLDAATQQPLAGVVIFGHYATVQGSVGGGESIAQVLHTFEVETDANGSFTIPAWDSGEIPIKGEPRSRFPMMGFYKDGYAFTYKNLQSLRHWVPSNKASTQDVTIKDNVYDWRAKPHLMTPVTSEKERYRALIDSRDGHVSVGECGWEKNVKFLMAQHLAWKDWLKKNVPSEGLAADGYVRSGFGHPDVNYRSSISNRSAVDNLVERSRRDSGMWSCQDPSRLFNLQK
jgi:uncharacterized protein (DUF2237 family)